MECMKEKFQNGVVLDGRYQTVSPLNHGSFGLVFMAKDLTNHQLVAIKCLTKKSATDESDSSFSIDEKSEELACHSRMGSHANIVNLIHSFETDAHVFLVLEYCSRGDLYEAIRTGTGPLETEHVRRFMLQLIDAVTYIHSKGMYHRDIKPENIFLTHSGNVKLGDFGLATTDKWSFESTVGSDRYMSPEQYDSAGAGYSPEHADIWAIGICLMNILFSRNPFTTPTESDPLFFDFSRDKQSLFDVFPTMSQDAYEVIANCMSLDPRKRSLAGAREALERAISFTTFDDPLDEFCSSDTRVIPHANREPLRTPSVQTPLPDNGSFLWAKALHAGPQVQSRQLSVIPDNESYKSEDLFDSCESIKDWFSVGQQTPSLSSMMDSNLGMLLKSSVATRRASKNYASLTPISGSLPIAMTKLKPLPIMGSAFGSKSEMMSKSWSDLWDEDFEEEEAFKRMQARKAQNARTYSHGSSSEDRTLRIDTLKPASDKVGVDSAVEEIKEVDGDVVADGFFFHGSPPQMPLQSPPYSPPPPRTPLDKWSALGDRRRAYTGGSDSDKEQPTSAQSWKEPRNGNVGLGFAGFGTGIGLWDNKANSFQQNKMHTNTRDHMNRVGVGPWVKESRVRDSGMTRQVKREDHGDLEWVKGLNPLHL